MASSIALICFLLPLLGSGRPSEEPTTTAAPAEVEGEYQYEYENEEGGTDHYDAVEIMSPTEDGCLTTAVLGRCCGLTAVKNDTVGCCGLLPILPAIHEPRCCRTGILLEIFVPVLTGHMCCGRVVVTRLGLQCCPGEISNYPFAEAADCPPDRKQ